MRPPFYNIDLTKNRPNNGKKNSGGGNDEVKFKNTKIARRLREYGHMGNCEIEGQIRRILRTALIWHILTYRIRLSRLMVTLLRSKILLLKMSTSRSNRAI